MAPAPPSLRLIPFEEDEPVADSGAVHNILLQLASQVATLVFTGGLTLYLVRALGASGYGVYALAVSIGALVVFPAGLGLPWAVGRFLADHRSSSHQLREIFRLGTKLQVPAALLAGGTLFALSGTIADAYGKPHLGWALRWVALSVVGQALFGFLTSVAVSVRRSAVSLWMTIIESAVETSTSVAFVLAGAGAAGAAVGKAVGYGVAMVAGIYLTAQMLGRRRRGTTEARRLSVGSLLRYAGAMFVVDVTWSAITQVDVLLIAALLSASAVGSFGAVLRVLAVAGYLGLSVSAGIAPRLSRAEGTPDVSAFEDGFRFLTIAQGLIIAPMIVWAQPIVHLLLGSGYRHADEIMRTVTPYFFISGPAALTTMAVTYLGEARRRVPIVIGTLVFGAVATYVLIRIQGVLGAATADDLIEVVYVGWHLWICSTLITFDTWRLARCLARTVVAAGAMSLVLLAVGTRQLSAVQWVIGACAGTAVFIAALAVTRELTASELSSFGGQLRNAVRRHG